MSESKNNGFPWLRGGKYQEASQEKIKNEKDQDEKKGSDSLTESDDKEGNETPNFTLPDLVDKENEKPKSRGRRRLTSDKN